MKVTVDEHKKVSADEYPKLMKHTKTKSIVMFTNGYYGMVLIAGNVGNNKYITNGYVDDKWEIREFTDFHGTITLEND